ncbi:MAG: SpaA isopeptide-forming pilin-related protein [Oscillospiraceae bacterium]|nr:MAG: SpaA isopeptide-forming pilin-related protein [Oscillospiraceae bacterium]
MSKHSTTHRTLSRRLAALLAALALLAAMALPVYAAAQNEDATKIAETVETVNETETTDDASVSTDPDDATDTTLSADDTNTTPAGETATDDTLDTSDEDTNNDGTEGANIENTGTADDAVAQPDNEVEDEVRVQEAATKEVTIYFLAPSGFDTTATVKFHARIQGEQDNDNWYTAQMTDSGKADRNGRKIFFTTVYPGQSPSCPYSGYSKIEFITSTANGDKLASYWGLGQNSLEWTSVYTYADQIYDADAGTWTAYTPFDPNNHQTFAGKTMFFQNQSGTDLANVQAVFCEKTNNGLQPVETIDLKAIAVGKCVSFKIPKKDCTYIRFIVDGKETSLYNFYDQQDEGENNRHFLYDSGTACYVYKGNDNDSSWTIPQGTITVYFDATFSSAYTEYNGAALSIPNGESKDVYCCFKNDSKGTTSNAQKMTSLGNNLYSVEVPGGYSEIMFSGDKRTSPANSGASTDWVPIDWSLDKPCYMADTNDAVVYNSGASRGGYWTEKDDVRDAEARKGTTVVDIDNTTSFVRDSATKYVTTTLYDYYTDWELNGNNRDAYDNGFSVSHRSWVPFRQFDLALSDYYKTSGSSSNVTNAVKYPIYTGHFQPGEYGGDYKFVDLHNQLQMNLFGFDEGRKFMVDNNSSLCTKDNEKNHGNLTVQGIVADDATNTSKDGLPVMRGTENSSKPLVEPHFNTEFLLGTNSKHTKLGEVYKNVAFPFTQNDVFGDGIKYWSFDAAETTLYLKQDKDDDSYFLQSSTNKKASKNRGADSTEKGETGFFPFNETVKDGASANNYNYGFGARLQFDFTLTDDGMVEGNEGKKPIRFFFSGDDDVWVFIDGKLALDVGGAHAKASGLLEFSVDGSSEYATAYVSGVKAGGTSEEDVRTGSTLQVKYKPSENASEIPIEFNYKGKTINLKKGTTHTLTMYYMERGMWESNMAVAFNFPDYNELQVKKEVDVNGVNDLFKNCFKDKRFFNFTIRNQATHYGTNDAKGDTVTTINLLEPTKSTSDKKDFTTTVPSTTDTGDENRFKIVNSPPADLKVTDGTTLLNWFAELEDLTPSPGSNKNKRYGILRLDGDQTIDISGMSYLSFDVYVDSKAGDAALSNMYLELRDSKGKQKGCLGQTFIGGKDLYGQVEMHNRQWITVKLSLDDVKAEEGFDERNVKELRFGCNYPRSIYLRNIVFSSKAVPQTVTGFTTKQEDIADYGSAQEGKLMPAVNAQYTSDAEKGTMVVDKNGGFVLKTGETISFKDQFRRGSYLSINEQVDKNLFDTQWTIYEDGKAVTSTKEGDGKKLTLDGDSISLKDKTGTAPDDGRIEVKNAEGDAAQIAPNYNAYDGIKPSKKDENDNTIVFRSYANPDATDAEGETQLKVVFVNTVKTGSLTINKVQDGKGDSLDGKTYKFMVRFTNVGGHALEDEAIVEPYEVTVGKPCVINNIPVGTRFTIEEVTPTDGSKLTNVSVTGGGSGTMVLNNQTVRGSIVAGDENKAVATFTNTKQETLDITGTKIWKNADNSLMTEHPATIYVQLQRRCVGETSELSWTPVTYLNETYTRVEQKYEGMKFSFLGLPAKDYDGGNQTPYEYRVVEGSVDNKGVFQAVDDEKTITIGEKVYSVTYKYTASKPDDSSNNNAKQTVTITNTQQDPKFTLDVTKKSAENDGENDKQKLLEGVEFTLEKLDENGQVDTSFETKTGITDGQGVLKLKNSGGSTSDKAFADLEAGTYRLTETKTAEGYNLLSAPIVITFTKDGQCRIGNDALMQAKNDTIFTGDAVNGYKLALTVLNRKTPALPHTGADAPSLWLLIGLPLAVAGLLILVFRYNKKGGRTR